MRPLSYLMAGLLLCACGEDTDEPEDVDSPECPVSRQLVLEGQPINVKASPYCGGAARSGELRGCFFDDF
ncbi:hypothetical protein [Pyxidicoccus xibeiensis]|uniref:hypothetical protein n=1 Tax=Pyxidicoccus xibeiensis TaxID=2906759 RepID=UPI0020A7B401|nr:hypothetical protein [Pyxidicoccus xibeiensis]MCP3137389.1 hypothetical protein [Pyxidicoccus xibeiensis]